MLNPDGSYTYTPNPNFSGVDTFTYTIVDDAGQTDTATVTITVTPQAIDDSVTTPFNTPVSVPVVTNDFGTTLTVTSVTQPPPGEGSVVIVANEPVYTPPPGYVGTTTFTYTVTDPAGSTSTATVTVTVAAPGAPVAVDDYGTTPVNTPLVTPAPGVLGNDSGSSITVQSNTTPSHGTVTQNADGSFTYTPDTDYSGPDSYTYTIVDGIGQTSTATVHITVTPLAVDDSATTPPATPVTIDVIPNDHGSSLTVTSVTQPPLGEGSVTIVGGKPVYTPPPGFSGTTTFTYTATDSAGQTTTATVTVTVPAAPHAAHARDDHKHGMTGPAGHRSPPAQRHAEHRRALADRHPAAAQPGQRAPHHQARGARRGHLAGRRRRDRDVHPGGRVHRRPDAGALLGAGQQQRPRQRPDLHRLSDGRQRRRWRRHSARGRTPPTSDPGPARCRTPAPLTFLPRSGWAPEAFSPARSSCSWQQAARADGDAGRTQPASVQGMSDQVAVVTDSTAYLPKSLAEEHGIRVVPVQVVIGGTTYSEGVDVDPAAVVAALREWRPVTTSRPTPQAFAETYAAAAAAGATAIVSVHLSSKMSGHLRVRCDRGA